MVQEVRRTVFRHGLAFYGTLAFVASFLGARLFATLNPTVTVVRGGIHFHHFWYGLAMVVSTGWLGITLSNERMGRNLAIIFGLGAGLIGDEVGLLLPSATTRVISLKYSSSLQSRSLFSRRCCLGVGST